LSVPGTTSISPCSHLCDIQKIAMFATSQSMARCNVAQTLEAPPPAPPSEPPPRSERILHGSDPWSELQKSGSPLLDFGSSLRGAKPRSLPAWERCTPERASEIQKRGFRISEAHSGVASLTLPYRSPSASRRARELPRKTKKNTHFFFNF
jgi:hypothetical protein